jgi:hypothetical protein
MAIGGRGFALVPGEDLRARKRPARRLGARQKPPSASFGRLNELRVKRGQRSEALPDRDTKAVRTAVARRGRPQPGSFPPL